METMLYYKTMILELIQQRPETYKCLYKERQILPALHKYSKVLKAGHEAWNERLLKAKPDSDPSQLATEALEIALKELKAAWDTQESSDQDEKVLSRWSDGVYPASKNIRVEASCAEAPAVDQLFPRRFACWPIARLLPLPFDTFRKQRQNLHQKKYERRIWRSQH
jgi:glutamine synthetase type III